MCDREQNCDEKRDHKDQDEKFPAPDKMLGKDEIELHIQRLHKEDKCQSGQKCGDKDEKNMKLYGGEGCGNRVQEQHD